MRHPLRFLLYIEWLLFAVVMAFEVAPSPGRSMERPIWFNIGVVALLAMMGLRLPTNGKLSIKILYTIGEIIPILVAGSQGLRLSWLLFVIAIIRSYLIFGRQYRLWIAAGIIALSFLTTTLRPERRKPEFRSTVDRPASISKGRSADNASVIPNRDEFRWGFAIMFAGILLSLQMLVDRMLAEKQAKDELAIANQRIRSYALKAEEVATLQERNRIAREIHDSLGHSLTALNLHLEMALKLAHVQPDRSKEVLTEAKRLGSVALNDVRASVSALRSNPLQGQDLPTAIHKLVDDLKLSNRIEPSCHLDLPPILPPDVSIAIYRIIQEALTNITKYAHATEAIVSAQSSPHIIELTISDNGRGFNPTHNTTGFGLQGMRERVLSLQGKFEIVSAPEQGCKIVAVIPLG
jgi:signal transduction histidine kinase